jgi:nucleoside-diphosphate-sugar epimerase
MKIAITGSSGLLGSSLLNQAIVAGHQVAPISFAHINSEPFAVSVHKSLTVLQGCDIVIHCAASKNPKSLFEQYLNIQVPHLIEQYIIAQQLACHLIHISSINVVINELQDNYTLSKRHAESLLDPKKTSIIRPGLIWSPLHDPNIRKITAYLKKSYLPHLMFKPGNWYSPIDPESLANFLVVKLDDLLIHPQTLHILGAQKYSLWQLVKRLADSHKIKLYPIPTAWFQFLPLRFFIKHSSIGEILNQLLPIDRTILPKDCIDSLTQLPYQEH